MHGICAWSSKLVLCSNYSYMSPKESNNDISLANMCSHRDSGSWTAGTISRKQQNYLFFFNNYKIVHISRSKYHWPIIWISGTLSARQIIAYFLSLKNGTFLFLRAARNEWSCSFSNVMNVHSHLFVSISMALSMETGAFQKWKGTGVSYQWQNLLIYLFI